MTNVGVLETIAGILAERVLPAVLVDDTGAFVWANDAFEDAFGYPAGQTPGMLLSDIVPPALRDAHVMGFSRMLQTGRGTLLNQPLRLATLCRDGSVVAVEAVLVAERANGRWQFGATLRPLE